MRFIIEYSKRGTAGCKKCKEKIAKGLLRIAKVSPNPWSEGDEMKSWFHAACVFEQMNQSKKAVKLESLDDLEGYEDILDEDQALVKSLLDKLSEETSDNSEKGEASKKADKKQKSAKSTPKKRAKKDETKSGVSDDGNSEEEVKPKLKETKNKPTKEVKPKVTKKKKKESSEDEKESKSDISDEDSEPKVKAKEVKRKPAKASKPKETKTKKPESSEDEEEKLPAKSKRKAPKPKK